MKEIICYQCEICGEIYKTKDKALECESIGKEEPLCKIGDIVKYNFNVSGFESQTEAKIYKIIDKGHYLNYYFKTKNYNGVWLKGLYGNEYMCGNEEFIRRTKI